MSVLRTMRPHGVTGSKRQIADGQALDTEFLPMVRCGHRIVFNHKIHHRGNNSKSFKKYRFNFFRRNFFILDLQSERTGFYLPD